MFEIFCMKKKLKTGYTFIVLENVVPEIDVPFYVLSQSDFVYKWTSQDNILRIVNTTYPRANKTVTGVETSRSVYTHSDILIVPGVYELSVFKNSVVVLTKTFYALEKEFKLDKLTPSCGIISQEFDVDMYFNQRMSANFILEIALVGKDTGAKHVFTTDEIRYISEDNYILHYNKYFTSIEDYELKIKMSDESKTEVISTLFAMFGAASSQGAVINIMQTEFVRDQSYNVMMNLTKSVAFTRGHVYVSTVNQNQNFSNVVLVSYEKYQLNDYMLSYIGYSTLILHNNGEKTGVCCYQKAQSTISMYQCTSITPLTGDATFRNYAVQTEQAIDTNDVDSFVFASGTCVMTVKCIDVPRVSKYHNLVAAFPYSGQWYVFVKYKQFFTHNQILAAPKEVYVTVS